MEAAYLTTLAVFLSSVMIMTGVRVAHIETFGFYGFFVILYLFWSWITSNDNQKEDEPKDEAFDKLFREIQNEVNSEIPYTEEFEVQMMLLVAAILDNIPEPENRKQLLEALNNRLMHFVKSYKNAPMGKLQTVETSLRTLIQNAAASQAPEWRYDPKLVSFGQWVDCGAGNDEEQKED